MIWNVLCGKFLYSTFFLLSGGYYSLILSTFEGAQSVKVSAAHWEILFCSEIQQGKTLCEKQGDQF